jgi:hypothetical protein
MPWNENKKVSLDVTTHAILTLMNRNQVLL